MLYSTIFKSQLEGAQRIDAEYYQPEYLNLINKLINFKSRKLSDIAFITDGEHSSPIFDETSGIKYFSAQHVKEFLIDSDALTIAKIIDDKNKRSRLGEGDILLSTVGTIGFAGIVSKEILPANMDRHVARIKLNPGTLGPEFLCAFLNSKFGKFQSFRESTGNVQLNLFIDKIKNLLVPPENNSRISNLVKEALELSHINLSSTKKAELLLLQELGLEDYREDNELCSVVYYSKIKAAERMDAEYFAGKCEIILNKCKKFESKTLGEIGTIKKGIEPGSEAYTESGKLFIRVSNLSKEGLTDNNQQYTSEQLYDEFKKECRPKIGEILLSKDATPGIAYVIKEDVEGITSGGIVKIKIDQAYDAEYVAFCINSVIGQTQVERDAGGSIIKHWKPDQIKNLVIPILPSTTQQKIAELVKQAHEARKKAKELLGEAKRKVEEMIEERDK